MGTPQQKPKLVKLLCDVSGSMYRFNGYDSRLEREMEAMLMVMEALEGYDQKIKVRALPILRRIFYGFEDWTKN
jgi:uncharacterized protein with von Willebrand factor type A (vWA) domain